MAATQHVKRMPGLEKASPSTGVQVELSRFAEDLNARVRAPARASIREPEYIAPVTM